MSEKLSETLRRQLSELELLGYENIDTSDISEQNEWSDSIVGLWNPIEYRSLGIDIRAIANEILERLWGRGVHPTNMSLNKLTWFVFEDALVKLKLLISPARIEAWEHGPVFREIYSPSKKYGDKPVAELLHEFSRDEKKMTTSRAQLGSSISNLIDNVLEEFGSLSASQLRELSHEIDGPWERVWNSGRKTSAGMVIGPHLIVASAELRERRNER